MSDEEAVVEEAVDDEAVAEEAVAEHSPYGCVESETLGERVLHPTRENWLATARSLLADGWNMCIDLTAVDYLSYPLNRRLPAGVAPERFEVVAGFINHSTAKRVRARTQVPASDTSIASLVEVYPGVDFLEREVFDMFGITFEGHPDMSRILMPETWDGHPLRKDYAVGAIPVQFKGPQGG